MQTELKLFLSETFGDSEQMNRVPDGEKRHSDHDPGVVVEGPDDVCGGRKFSWRFGNPVHGVYSNTVRIVHQRLSLVRVADDGDPHVRFSITHLARGKITRCLWISTSYPAHDSIEGSILISAPPVASLVNPLDVEVVLVYITLDGHPLNRSFVNLGLLFETKISCFNVVRYFQSTFLLRTDFTLILQVEHSQRKLDTILDLLLWTYYIERFL